MDYISHVTCFTTPAFLTLTNSIEAQSVAGAVIFTSFQITEFACKVWLAEAETIVALTVTGTIAGARFFVAGRSRPALVANDSQIR